jgi:hypothetical protein
MSTQRLYRVGGGAVVIGGLVVIAGTLARLPFAWDAFNNAAYVAKTLLQIAGSILVLMGLPAIAVFVANRSAWLGIAIYVGLWIPTVFLNVASNFLNVSIGPYLLAHGGVPKELPGVFMPILLASIATWVVAGVVIGVGIIRTKVFPIWVVGLIFLGVACEFIPIDAVKNAISPSVVFAAVASMGWLVTTRNRADRHADRGDAAQVAVRA